MVDSVQIGVTTEGDVKARWGLPTQRIREGAQVTYVYRNMTNPPGYRFPQYGNSSNFVLIEFQYGLATDVRGPFDEGCRATFPPRPPGPGFDNPTTVHPANCGVLEGVGATSGGAGLPGGGVPADRYGSGLRGKL